MPWRRIGKALLFPPTAIRVILLPVAAGGLVYTMLNIPQEVFTPLFAIARVAGWCAHRIEEVMTSNRIIRPAYKSLTQRRTYVPMAKRE